MAKKPNHATEKRNSPLPPAIVFHGLAHAQAALAAAEALGVPVTLISAPGAAAYAGPGWFRAVVDKARAAHPGAEVTAVLDCGDMSGHALAALRDGVKAIRFAGATADKVAEIAAQSGARVIRKRPEALDLQGVAGNPVEACRDWLEGHIA